MIDALTRQLNGDDEVALQVHDRCALRPSMPVTPGSFRPHGRLSVSADVVPAADAAVGAAI